jgi:predicted transcriptional regulator of viral defense system
MLQRIVKAVGKARQGKSVEQLQQKLGWTKTQIRNAISRASAQGLVENIAPGRYRQKV